MQLPENWLKFNYHLEAKDSVTTSNPNTCYVNYKQGLIMKSPPVSLNDIVKLEVKFKLFKYFYYYFTRKSLITH